MIDDPLKTMALMARMNESLPIATVLTPHLRGALRERSPGVPVPEHCRVVEIFYFGDEGGIGCSLDLGGSEAKTAHVVSLTHLRLDRRSPLFHDVDAYQRRRIKKLKRQGAGRS